MHPDARGYLGVLAAREGAYYSARTIDKRRVRRNVSEITLVVYPLLYYSSNTFVSCRQFFSFSMEWKSGNISTEENNFRVVTSRSCNLLCDIFSGDKQELSTCTSCGLHDLHQ